MLDKGVPLLPELICSDAGEELSSGITVLPGSVTTWSRSVSSRRRFAPEFLSSNLRALGPRCLMSAGLPIRWGVRFSQSASADRHRSHLAPGSGFDRMHRSFWAKQRAHARCLAGPSWSTTEAPKSITPNEFQADMVEWVSGHHIGKGIAGLHVCIVCLVCPPNSDVSKGRWVKPRG